MSRPIINEITDSLKITLPYLHLIAEDKATGVMVHVQFVYFCRGMDKNGDYGECKPIMTRVAVTFNLPTSSSMVNPLKSSRMTSKLEQWVKKVAMTSPAITNLVGMANERVYFDTNGSAEGTFGSGKHT